MLHQAEKERQIVFVYPLFIEREEKTSAIGLKVKVAVLDAFGDALETQRLADIVAGEQHFEVLKGDVGVDRHGPCFPSRACLATVRRVLRRFSEVGCDSKKVKRRT